MQIVFSLYCTAMDPRTAADGILREAESDLRDLIRKELQAERYAAIAEVAGLAEAVSELRTNISGPAKSPRRLAANPTAKGTIEPKPAKSSISDSKGDGAKPTSGSAASRPRRAKASPYPRFELGGDSLTKIGWSKKAKSEYQHTAPFDAVIGLANHIVHRTEPNRIWTVESLGEVTATDGAATIPNYQIYLILAWMRDMGIVLKHGRSGYSTPEGIELTTAVSDLLTKQSQD